MICNYRKNTTQVHRRNQIQGKGVGKKSGRSRHAAEIRDDTSKPKKKKRIVDVDDEEDEEEEDCNKPRKKPVTARGIVIKN